MPKFKRSRIPISGVVYGDIIYWATILASVLVLVGTVETFVSSINTIPPAYLLSSVIEGKSVAQIWQGTSFGAIPHGHW
ncbi:MAG: hypothetical protein ACKVHL_09280, partial [Rhodospirillales bacterium]